MHNKNQDLNKTLQLLRDGLHNTIQSFRVYRVEENNMPTFPNPKESQHSEPSSTQEKQLISLNESYFDNTIHPFDTTAANLTVLPAESSSSVTAINKIRGKLNIHDKVSQVKTKHGKRKQEPSTNLKIWKDNSDISAHVSEQNIFFVDEDLKNKSFQLLSQPSSANPNSDTSQFRSSETFLTIHDINLATTSPTNAEKDLIIENQLKSFLSDVESYIKEENLDQDDPDDIINNTSTYFNDGDRKVDYILVYHRNNSAKMETYLYNIRVEGLDTEVEESKIYNFMFAKIHAPKAFLKKMERRLPMKWSFRNPYYFERKSAIGCANTSLTRYRDDDNISERAPQLVHTIIVTDAERIMAIHKLLTETKFGKQVHAFGLERLIESKIMVCAFPMHDKMWEWNNVGMLSDRQLLNKYWANFNCIFKVQPKQLINKYFGNEIAFYFAWLGFFTEMLLPAVILGLIVFLYGGSTANVKSMNVQSYDILKSNVFICPVCQTNCFYSHLSDSYEISKVSYVLDNAATAIFNILMSFWGVTFLILWKQKERFLKIVWNLTNVKETDTNKRANFYVIKKRKGFTTLTDIEKYKKRQSNWWYLLSIIVMVIGTFLIMNMIFGLLIMKMDITQLCGQFKLINELIYTIDYNKLRVEFTWSTITIVMIMLTDTVTPNIVYRLTISENPKTENEFEKSYILKLFVLTFITNFSIPIYLAFFRGIFYIPPSEIKNITHANLKHDVCDPSGCMVTLACWMTTIIILRLAKALMDLFAAKITISFKSLSPLFNFPNEREKNYRLLTYSKTQLIQLHIENVIQYGFVVCFVAAFPLIPFLVWITSAIKMRLYAMQLIRYKRRPIPTVTTDLGIWNKIVAIMTYIGLLIHILVIAFTTEIIPKFIFFIQNLQMKNYIHSKLTDFYYVDELYIKDSTKFCEYVGYRNGSSLNYAPIYFKIIGGKLLFTIIMEHLVIMFVIIFTYYVPVISSSMKKYFNQIKEL